MATTCIRRPGSGTYAYLCKSEDVKPSVILAKGAALPSQLTVPENGAPDVCPECAVIHVSKGLGFSKAQRTTILATLYARVAGEVRGKRQAASTLQRYVDAGCRPTLAAVA